ncbi:MAG: phasin family protein [Kiloniellales bacterium]
MTTKTDANPTQAAAKSAAKSFDAVNASAAAMTAGIKAYGKKLASYAKTAASENVETMGRLLAAKTPQEFAAVQIEALSRSVDLAVAQSVELNKIATDTFVKTTAPVRSQMDAAVEAFVKPFQA